MTTYTAVLEQSESGAWSGYVPGLPTILSIGESRAECKDNIAEAIGFWMKEARADGIAIPAPSSQSASISVAA